MRDTEEPRPLAAQSAFDEHMKAYVRQSMPLPPAWRPSRTEAWTEMRRLLEDLILAEGLDDAGDPEEWEVKQYTQMRANG
jgi:hypothetical protein